MLYIIMKLGFTETYLDYKIYSAESNSFHNRTLTRITGFIVLRANHLTIEPYYHINK